MLRTGLIAAMLIAAPAAARSAGAQEQILFPAIHNAKAALIERIRSERVRLDVATWLLEDREVTQAILDAFRSGVSVRVLGDRVSIFESSLNTRNEFLYLASNGVPIRIRYVPTSFPEILHWKSTIFVGQGMVEFGSANYTTFELAPWSPTNFKDETALFTNDPQIFRAFLTQFDRMWADTDKFLDWPQAYARETGVAWTTPMAVSPTRSEPDYPTDIPGMVWGQGPDLNRVMVAEMERETRRIDLVSYRLTDPTLTDALIRRFRAGVQVRVFIEPTQYRNRAFPEYWMVGTMADRLWAAGVPVKQRVHDGLTHMKSLVTSNVALVGSSNFTRRWERDHNYFIPASGKPALYFAVRDRIDAMWNDAANYTAFSPRRPDAARLQSPASGSGNVSNATLVWQGAAWATSYDVYLGTSPQQLSFVGRVNAAVSEEPPATYSFAPPQALAGSTVYYWEVVSRTDATNRNASLVASSDAWSFTTAPGGATGVGSATCRGSAPASTWSCIKGAWIPPAGFTQPTPPPPTPPEPAPQPEDPEPVPPPTSGTPPPTSGTPPPAPSTCTTPRPGADWVCVNGGWMPPGMATTPPPATPAPPPVSSGSCTTPQPGAGWVCVNGGWVPPGWPGLGTTAPAPPANPVAPPPVTSGTCTTPKPASTWVCVGSGWVPPDWPGLASGTGSSPSPGPAPAPAGGATCAGRPDPFVSLGGGVCVNGGWVPRGHPAAGGRI